MDPAFGPLQLVVVGFHSTEGFRGEIAREIAELRGRGLIRVLDARLLTRDAEGELSEIDLNPVIGEAVGRGRPAAHLFGLNGAAHVVEGEFDAGAFTATAGFALEDLRRLTDEIEPGDHAAVVLLEHRWAGRLREKVRGAGGLLLAQGMLTPEVMMIVGAELQATADAEAAIELAEAARGAALLDTLATLQDAEHERANAAGAVVRTLIDAGVLTDEEAGAAVDALARAGIVEQALLQGAVAEVEELLGGGDDDDAPAG